jgi:succinate-semialdehyde dehydrogenase/glutarate-semialdehyde dehydrogenase
MATSRTDIPDVGYFVPPTVLAKVSADNPILGHEIFGPVAPIVSFTTEDQVIKYANATHHGLVAFVFHQDLTRALRVPGQLEAGMVGINRGLVSDPAAPFGGWKGSGLGREGGHEGMLEYLEQKYIAVDWRPMPDMTLRAWQAATDAIGRALDLAGAAVLGRDSWAEFASADPSL